MDEKIKSALVNLGLLFKNRRKQMGRSAKELADHVSISANTLERIEDGKFDWDTGLTLKICEALELKPFFVALEELGRGSLPNMDGKSKFLLCPDIKTNELYILHRHRPACLVLVVQTTPVTFRIVDLFDEVEETELVAHPFLDEMKRFWKDYQTKN